MIKAIKTLLKIVIGAGLLYVLLLGSALAYPAPMFGYVVKLDGASGRSLAFHSDVPIPDSARDVLADIAERLEGSPLKVTNQAMQLYVVRPSWKRRLLWSVTNAVAGGFIVAPLTRHHAFLSGADFERGLLISPSGKMIKAPRTLAYFGAHELTHAQTAQGLSTIQYHRLPSWIREGLADYVAFRPRQSFKELYEQIGDRDADLAMMNAYGVYAPDRLLVSYFLDVKGWSAARLMASGLSKSEARGMVGEFVEGRT